MSSQQTVPIKNLESLLQKCLNCKQLELIDYTSTNMVSMGENYCSSVVKIDAKIRRSLKSKTETLHMVAKKANINTVNSMTDWNTFFRKEVFIYSQLIPAYQSIERELGINPVIDINPKFIGYRSSLNYNDDVVDDDSIFLMENMRLCDYYLINRKIGVDVLHAKKVLSCIARYHALGVALRQRRPDIFAKAQNVGKNVGINFDEMDAAIVSVLQMLRTIPSFEKYMPAIESSAECQFKGRGWLNETVEPWVTVSHGDLWVNNLLFHKDEKGNVDNVKFIDYQIFLCNSPLKDIAYFFLGSLDRDAKANHIGQLIDFYYEKFIRWLERLKCNVTPFTKESFDEELKRQANTDLAMICLAIKFFTYEIEEEEKNGHFSVDVVLKKKSSDVLITKLQEVIDVCEKMDWI